MNVYGEEARCMCVCVCVLYIHQQQNHFHISGKIWFEIKIFWLFDKLVFWSFSQHYSQHSKVKTWKM